jgi:hypothetical protein
MLISNVPPSTATVSAGAVECVSIVLSPGAIRCIEPQPSWGDAVSSICHSGRLIRADYPVDIVIGVVIGGSKGVSRMMFGLIAALRIVRDLERSLLRLDGGRRGRLGLVSGRLTARGIRRLTPRGIAIAKARNTTAVEADNTTFWSAFRSAHETSRDGAVGLAPRSRWRCGHLRQAGERTLRSRNRRCCCYVAWRLAVGTNAVYGRDGSHCSASA